jgi:hypothetical protein
MNGAGDIHVLYGYRSLTPHEELREAHITLELMKRFNCSHVAHDYTGAGRLREKFIVDAGIPLDRIVPCWYVPAATQGIMKYCPASEAHPRDHYKIDKASSLALTCNQVRMGGIKFFDYDHINKDQPGLLHDFLALVEERSDGRTKRDNYLIIRENKRSDDFAQAVNIGACTLWYMTEHWPNLAQMSKYRVDMDLINAVNFDPTMDPEWGSAY